MIKAGNMIDILKAFIILPLLLLAPVIRILQLLVPAILGLALWLLAIRYILVEYSKIHVLPDAPILDHVVIVFDKLWIKIALFYLFFKLRGVHRTLKETAKQVQLALITNVALINYFQIETLTESQIRMKEEKVSFSQIMKERFFEYLVSGKPREELTTKPYRDGKKVTFRNDLKQHKEQ